MNVYKVIWHNEEVGQLNNALPEMWYIEGDWTPNETGKAVQFTKTIESLNSREVLGDLSKGVIVKLSRPGVDDELSAVGISLTNGKLFLRRLTKEQRDRI